MKLDEIASRINAHLKRIEADKSLNRGRGGSTLLYNSYAHRFGNRVFCTYKSFQGQCGLKKKDAIAYLEKLDAGCVGRHYEALREDEA